MTIVVLSGGARGDTQPYAALALGFQRAGHRVRFATIPEFAPLVEGSGVEVVLNDVDVQGLLGSGKGTEMLNSGRNSVRFLLNFSRLMKPLLERGTDRLVDVCRDADGMVLASPQILLGTLGNERLGVPFLAAYPMPASATCFAPNVLMPELPAWVFGRQVYNRLTHWAFARITHGLLGRLHQQVLAALPAPRWMQTGPMPVLYGYSPEVSPRPPDWPAHVQVTGYWFLDSRSDYQPRPELAAFLAARPAPVGIGFGSMNDRNPEGLLELISQALELAGVRGILVAGWSGLRRANLPGHMLALDSVPYDWLFPRLAAVVHHCGAGTIGATLRAGIPMVGVPHFADQFFWARRVAALGAGPTPVPRRRLTAARLARAIRKALDTPLFRERAAELGSRIRSERGVERAVELAERRFRAGNAARQRTR